MLVRREDTVNDTMKKLLEEAQLQGFDKAEVTEEDELYIGCSQCAALAINNVACHEMGCPNKRNWSCGGAGDDCPTCYPDEDELHDG